MNALRAIFYPIIVVLSVAACSRVRESHNPPTVSVGDQRASFYLTPEYRAHLLRTADESPNAAAALANYYLLCMHDQHGYKHWSKVYSSLIESKNSAEQKNQSLGQLTENELLEAVFNAQQGSAIDARRIADFYLVQYQNSVYAFPWMQRAAELGDLEAKTMTIRLKVELGLLSFEEILKQLNDVPAKKSEPSSKSE